MDKIDFTTGYWKDVQFRVKTLEELETLYGYKLTSAFHSLDCEIPFVGKMFQFCGKPFPTTSKVIEVWMGLKNWVEIDECDQYAFVREWITHNKIEE